MPRNLLSWMIVGCLLIALGCVPTTNVPTNGDMDDASGGDAHDDVVAPMFAVFEDPQTGFKTSDLYDSDGEIVRFNLAGDTLIFAADGTEQTGWHVNGLYLDRNSAFLVRFGTEHGQPRAYFTETGPATICDIQVQDGVIFIFPTELTVPQT